MEEKIKTVKIDDVLEPIADNIAYHLENIVCFGCHKEFCLTVRNPENEDKLCGTCFGHIIGLDAYQEISESFDSLSLTIWTTPTEELSEDIMKQMKFIKKSRNVE